MKKAILAVLAGALGMGVLLATAGGALAYRGDPNVKGPYYSEERHEAMTKAFENKDYNAWKNLMQGKGKVTQLVTKENFARFAEMHKLMLDGKTDEAAQIRQELGLGLGNGSGRMSAGRMGR